MATWEQPLNDALARVGDRSIDGKVLAVRTQNITKEVLKCSFRRLHALGYKVEGPAGIKDKHIAVLVRDWWTSGKSPKTIENEISRLRVFFSKMGKPGLVRKTRDYLTDVDLKELVVKPAAVTGKTWAAQGVDTRDVISKIDDYDPVLGRMVLMQLAFGLSREEVIKCQPHEQDMGVFFEVPRGHGKGGRVRRIAAGDRQILDYVKQRVKPGEYLGWQTTRGGQEPTLKQNLSRYTNAMSRLGFTKKNFGATGEGLRAEFGENYALLSGIIPASMGASGVSIPPVELHQRMEQISDALAQQKPDIVLTYLRAFGRESIHQEDVRTVSNIEAAIKTLKPSYLEAVAMERRLDCARLRDVLEALGIDVTLRQVQALWKIFAARLGMEWTEPTLKIAISMEGAALTLLAQEQSKPLNSHPA